MAPAPTVSHAWVNPPSLAFRFRWVRRRGFIGGIRRLVTVIAKQENSISEKLKVTILYSKYYTEEICPVLAYPLYIIDWTL